jgi:hypothetical protein
MKPRISTKFKPNQYHSFIGLSTARADISLERPDSQPFIAMENLLCTSKGYLTNEAGVQPFSADQRYVSHVKVHDSSRQIVAYATSEDGGTSLRSTQSTNSTDLVWPAGASISSAAFNGYLVMVAGSGQPQVFDGQTYQPIASPTVTGARYVCQAANRLIMAGFDDDPTEITVSRVDSHTIWNNEESIAEPSVLKAFRFNIRNLLGSGDVIKGISTFGIGNLAIFTKEQVLVYHIDPDYTLLAIDSSVMVRYGTISHRSIVAAGGEVFFCSRSGVHSLRRSMMNGTTTFTVPMSEDIMELYQDLYSQVSNKELINACFDPDEGRVHIFFPVNGVICYRLSAALTPPKNEQEITSVRWSMATYAGMTCGDSMSGRMLFGSISGIVEMDNWYSDEFPRGNGEATLPVLWHKDLFNPKNGLHLVLYASGSGTVEITAHDETDRELGVITFEMPDTGQTNYSGVPLQRQFIRPFPYTYVGLRLRIKIISRKMVRIFSIGINTKEP